MIACCKSYMHFPNIQTTFSDSAKQNVLKAIKSLFDLKVSAFVK